MDFGIREEGTAFLLNKDELLKLRIEICKIAGVPFFHMFSKDTPYTFSSPDWENNIKIIPQKLLENRPE